MNDSTIPLRVIHPNEAIAIPVGAVAPDFTLQDTDGINYNLSAAIKEKPVVLVFYRGDWCAWCQLQTAQLAQNYDKFLAASVALWAISPQDRATNQAFGHKRGITYPILEDTAQRVIRRWGLLDELDPHQENIPYPTTYVIGRDGRVHWRRLGHDKKDRPTPQEILNALP